MSDVIRIVNEDRSHAPVPVLPEARVTMRVRAGVLSDYPFIDALQKANKHGVGFMWEKAIKGHIEKGNVLVAEAAGVGDSGLGIGEALDVVQCLDGPAPTPKPQLQTPSPAPPVPVGYVLGVDRYLKRDELGVIYQMCVVPEYRRSLVAANLLKAKFESSAYGCRLYCCWCAQDLAANRFWEAMGFVPLAFRTGGGRGKTKKDGKFRGRMHIFWQKRIREGDTGDPATGGTPYWFPSMTGAGAIGEDRIVLPIPPGTSWADAKPVVLPEGPNQGEAHEEIKLLEDAVSRLEREKKEAAEKRKKAREKGPAEKPSAAIEVGGMRFGSASPAPGVGAVAEDAAASECAVQQELKAAKKAVRQAKKKFDPAQMAFARELKDRWLEQVQAQPHLLAQGAEKYAVRRQIDPAPAPAPGIAPGSSFTLGEPPEVVAELIDGPKRLDAA